uniref:Uncharacterized protein n=1 Tax=Setaria viridis TaxID=4556 RepID=A0A4U6U269_SETVI|nr:hypothetical protein SEVIR_6G115650v2 [Setaria viridis]
MAKRLFSFNMTSWLLVLDMYRFMPCQSRYLYLVDAVSNLHCCWIFDFVMPICS